MSEKDLNTEKTDAIQENISSDGNIENATEKETNKPQEKSASETKDTIAKEENLEVVKENIPQKENQQETKEHIAEESHQKKQYDLFSLEELITEFKSLLKNKAVQHIKTDVEAIKKSFNLKFNEEYKAIKEKFITEGGDEKDFEYTSPLKKEFNSLLFDYKEKRNAYLKQLNKNLKENLEKRLALIEELKGLLNTEESINTTYKQFKNIQERWFEAGPIPRDKYDTVWNNYHHHVENFYDFLHLNREFRDLDFKHNLEQKQKIIQRAEELAQEEDINKAFRELQMLHKVWKEEVGPVAKEFRDEIWDKFTAATKVIHDKRQEYLNNLESIFEENYQKKQAIIEEIKTLISKEITSHQGWQNAINKVQELRDAFFNIGKVPKAKNKEIWKEFKDVTSAFNKAKNAFYKNQKNQQFENLEKKKELIKIAEENKDSEDFDAVTPLMKKIQNDWKKIGHVPRKESDKIWKQFKDACNHYFNRLSEKQNEANKEQLKHFEIKTKLLDKLKEITLTGDVKEDVKLIKEHISQWKKIGKVPLNKRSIEREFAKTLDALFAKINLDKKEVELIKFENKLNAIASSEDTDKLNNEAFYINKKIGEITNQIRQLENNLGFFQHADQNNPLVKDVHKNIAKHKEQLKVWKTKLKKIKELL
jgi:hypothetical protein